MDLENEYALKKSNEKMCRICLHISEGMNCLFSMQFADISSSDVITFLRRITELKVE